MALEEQTAAEVESPSAELPQAQVLRALGLMAEACALMGAPVVYIVAHEGRIIVGQRGDERELRALLASIKEAL